MDNKNGTLYELLEELNKEKLKEFIRSEYDEDSEYFKRCRNITIKMIDIEFGKETVERFLESKSQRAKL